MDSQRPPSSRPGADIARLRIDRGDDVGRGRGQGVNLLWVVLVLLLLGGGWLFRDAIFARVSEATTGSARVRTALARKVVPGEAKDGDVAANGYVVADRQASLASVISGRLVELNAQEGDIVEADAVVARVQYDDLEAQEQEANARAEAARALVLQATRAVDAAKMDVPRLAAERGTFEKLEAEARENADRLLREVERNRPLVPQGVSADVFDRLEAQARGAQRALEAASARVAANRAQELAWAGEISRREAELAVAEAQVAVAEGAGKTAAILVEKTKIRAPFRGLVIRKDAEKGEVIAPTGGGQNSKGSVLTIVDPESFEMQVELNERRIGKVAEGDRARIRLDAAPDTPLAGTVRKIWPRADRAKGTVEVRVAFVERSALARPDMAGQVTFLGKVEGGTGGQVEPAYVTVPAEAVVRRGDADVVFVVEQGVARQVKVVLGAPRDGQAVVAQGLSGGETLVLAPSVALVDGERVATP
jgi:RND family efflux transporter MFP subunit